MKKNASLPAFARPYSRDEFSGDRPESLYSQDGLTKREYFAAKALQGLLASGQHPGNDNLITESAVDVADELLRKLDSMKDNSVEIKEALEKLCYTLSDNEIPQSEIKKAYEAAVRVLNDY